MAIYNLGSINADHVYRVPHLPAAGETLAATAHSIGLGGKGTNQSIAAAQGGAVVHHIGAVGTDGAWAIEDLRKKGVGVSQIATLDIPTGHAIINVDANGENAIVIFSSANTAQDKKAITSALADATAQDYCLLQNETNLVPFAAELARSKGVQVVYSAAPFDADAVEEVLPFVDILAVNEGEAQQLAAQLGVAADRLPVAGVLITKGSKGAVYQTSGQKTEVAAFAVDPVDTTGAGDTYLGFFVAGMDAGMDIKGAMTFAAAAAALEVTKPGAADAIPTLSEVKAFLEDRLKR